MERLHERKVTRHEGRNHHSADPPPTTIDRLDDAEHYVGVVRMVAEFLTLANQSDAYGKADVLGVLADQLDAAAFEFESLLKEVR